MRVIEFQKENQKKIWNDFVRSCPGSSFLQSWEWGEVEKADGRKIRRLIIEGDIKDEKIFLMSALIVKRDLPFQKSYFYIPRGPLFFVFPTDPFLWQEFLYRVKEVVGPENIIFLKINLTSAASVPLW